MRPWPRRIGSRHVAPVARTETNNSAYGREALRAQTRSFPLRNSVRFATASVRQVTDPREAAQQVVDRGWSVGAGAVPAALLGRLQAAFAAAVEHDLARRPASCTEEPGRVLSLLDYGGPFLELAELPGLLGPFDGLLGSDCIYYTMTSSWAPPGATAGPLHVDSTRTEGTGFLSVGAIVMLDDYTAANGGIRFLGGSSGTALPDPDEFRRDAELVVAPAGSICWFDPCIWHGRGPNRTDVARRAVVIGMVRPWMKQRLDHPAMLDDRSDGLSATLRQKLGFDSRVPSDRRQYYRRGAGSPPETVASTHPHTAAIG